MKKILLLLASAMWFVLAGCAQINSDISINSDMSGEYKAIVISEGGPLEKSAIEQTMTMSGYTNKDAKIYPVSLDENGKAKKIDATESPTWEVDLEFKNPEELAKVHSMTTNSLKSKDVIVEQADGSYRVDLGTASGTVKVSVPGTIVKESVGTGMVDGDTVTYQQGGKVVLEYKKTSFVYYIGGAVVLAVLAFVGWTAYKRKIK